MTFNSDNNGIYKCVIGVGSILLFASVCTNISYYNKNTFLLNNIKDLKQKLSVSNSDLRESNTRNLILNDKISNYNLNNAKYDNISNWNNALNSDIYDAYLQNIELKPYIYFTKEFFKDYVAIKLCNLDFIEFQTFLNLNKMFYGSNYLTNFNKFNYYFVNYELKAFFDKIRFLFLDTNINALLYEKYNNKYPYYKPVFTPLNYVLEKQVPYSLSPQFSNKYFFNNIYSGLNYINKDIKPFSP